MSQIDRTNKEKVIKIGPWTIKYGTLCALGLLIILSFSSLAYLETYFSARSSNAQTESENKIQVVLVISFDENTSIPKTKQIESGMTALFAFKEVANITFQDNGPAGKMSESVSVGNITVANNGTHSWYFYSNGGINFKGLDLYSVSNGDVLELKYARNLE